MNTPGPHCSSSGAPRLLPALLPQEWILSHAPRIPFGIRMKEELPPLTETGSVGERGKAIPRGYSLAPCGAASPAACVGHPATLGGDGALTAGALFVYRVGRFFR